MLKHSTPIGAKSQNIFEEVVNIWEEVQYALKSFLEARIKREGFIDTII
jgi:hypothetical protein